MIARFRQLLPDIVSVVENASLVLIGEDPAWDSRMQNGLQRTGLPAGKCKGNLIQS